MQTTEETAQPIQDIADISVPRMTSRARRAYLQVALDRCLQHPFQVHRRLGSVCVVVFGVIAFVNRRGMVSIARHERGLLIDLEAAPHDCIDELPVRPTAQGAQAIATQAIIHDAARSLGEWAGEPVDLRSLDQSDWSDYAGTGHEFDNLFAEATQLVDAIPSAKWRAIAVAVPRLLGIDLALVKASRAAQLGALSALEIYHHAHRCGLQHLRDDEATPQVLVAHILCATHARPLFMANLQTGAMWLQRELQQEGVTPLGWRLLLDSPIGYWRRAFRSGGYDLQLTRLTLLVGQKLSPPRLPPLEFAAAAHDIAWEHELGDRMRHVPPQVWRTLVALHEETPAVCKEVMGEILPWASSVGAGMPAPLRQAGYRTLEQHALAHLLDHVPDAPVAIPRPTIHRYQEQEGHARELVTAEAVTLVGRMMGNCLPILWPEIQAGRMRAFFGVWREQRIVIGLRPNPEGPGWRVNQIEGRRRKRVRKEGWAFAERLSETLCPNR